MIPANRMTDVNFASTCTGAQVMDARARPWKKNAKKYGGCANNILRQSGWDSFRACWRYGQKRHRNNEREQPKGNKMSSTTNICKNTRGHCSAYGGIEHCPHFKNIRKKLSAETIESEYKLFTRRPRVDSCLLEYWHNLHPSNHLYFVANKVISKVK